MRARTRLQVNGNDVDSVHVEACLISAYVVNVFPTLLYSVE